MSDERHNLRRVCALARRHLSVILLLVAAAGLALYLAGVPHNPPGFFVDESSIAYNAYRISQDGADEHGVSWPLYFRAFGEYKSPIYIYLLAALYKITGPSIAVARGLSAVLGVAAAMLLGMVAARSVRDALTRARARVVGLCVALSALLTPWLFETSRLVFEVALMPLALALLLLALKGAHERALWTWADSLRVACALALITYTYSNGRLLAPLLALGRVFFAKRARWRHVILRTWLIYAVTLLPLLVFHARHPGALTERFAQVSFVREEMTWWQIALRFFQNYAGSFNPWSWLVAGDPEPRHHVQTMGSLLAATVAAGLIGLVIVVIRRRRDAWWRFVVYGLVVSPVPAALTLDHFHTLRLVGLPVFLLMLAACGFAWLLEGGGRARRLAFAALILFTLAQGALFQWQFREAAPRRLNSFDAHYPEVFTAAMREAHGTVYLIDNDGSPGYIHAYWYATLRGEDTQQFVRLHKDERPPPSSLVISSELPCTRCRIIREGTGFRAYVAE